MKQFVYRWNSGATQSKVYILIMQALVDFGAEVVTATPTAYAAKAGSHVLQSVVIVYKALKSLNTKLDKV